MSHAGVRQAMTWGLPRVPRRRTLIAAIAGAERAARDADLASELEMARSGPRFFRSWRSA